jgi:hypothetical protein
VYRWHLASRELVSGRVEILVLKVTRHEDAKRRSGERFGAIHLRRTGGRDREISRTREFAEWKPKYWVFKVARCEDAKRRRSERIGTVH